MSRYEYRVVTKGGDEATQDAALVVRWSSRRQADKDRVECDRWDPWDSPHRVQRRQVSAWEDVSAADHTEGEQG